MKRLIIVLLLAILFSSYFAQQDQLLRRLRLYLAEGFSPSPAVVIDKPKPVQKPEQQVENLAYPAPGDQPVSPYPYIPPTEWQPTIITPDLGSTPTLAPSYSP